MGNRKSLKLWNPETPERWNTGTLKLWNPGPLEYVTIVLHHLTGKWEDFLPFALRSTLIQQCSSL